MQKPVQVLVMRHGPALEREDWNQDDALRPLSKVGIEKTRAAARGLKYLEVRPQVLATSPLTRAVQTAQILEEELQATLEVWPELALLVEEDADLEPIRARLEAAPSTCTLLVGHEPGCSRLLSLLLGSEVHFKWKKAGAACVEDGALLWFVTAGILRSSGRRLGP